VRHEVVHNKFVVEQLRHRGALFVDDLDDVPDDVVVIFSAHGVATRVRSEAERRRMKVIDATCPLVTKVHTEVDRFAQVGIECVLIGHSGHPEVEGTMGQYDRTNGGQIYLVENVSDVDKLKIKNSRQLGYVTQTTLSIDDTGEIVARLRTRFPDIQGPRKSDICYATQNRQDAVKQLAIECDVVLVVGSRNSSNSNRLKELAQRCGAKAYLIDSYEDIQPSWLSDDMILGITAGASAPEILVGQVLKCFGEQGATLAHEMDGVRETVRFTLPVELR
jgi:4-hydroxy-3-methylbut-2-enyl diphosphate reductase